MSEYSFLVTVSLSEEEWKRKYGQDFSQDDLLQEVLLAVTSMNIEMTGVDVRRFRA